MQDWHSSKHLQTNFYKADSGAYGQQNQVPRTASDWAQILENTPGIESVQALPLSGVFQELGVTHVYSGLLSLRTSSSATCAAACFIYTCAARVPQLLAILYSFSELGSALNSSGLLRLLRHHPTFSLRHQP